MIVLYVIDFGKERYFLNNFTYNEFKDIVHENINKLNKIADKKYSNLEDYKPGYFFVALSGIDDKFVAIENTRLVDEDLFYLYNQHKKYLVITSTLYNAKTGELLEFEDKMHQPRMVETSNPARPSLLFCEVMNESADNLQDELSQLLSSDALLNSKESYIKEEIDSIFEEYSTVPSLLIHDNVFYGNFKRQNTMLSKIQQFTFSI